MKSRLFAAAVLLAASPAAAAEPVNMLMIDGTCQTLILGADDFSAACQDQVLQMVYDTGRAGLYAFADEMIVTFSGASDEIVDSEIHQTLDQVLLGHGENNIRAEKVKGTCIFENPYQGVAARFTCTANKKDGTRYDLVFITDGNAPVDRLATE